MIDIPGSRPHHGFSASASRVDGGPSGTALLVLSQLPWIAFASMMVYMAVAMSAAGGIGPTVWVGLINRLFLAAMCSWLLFVVRHAQRVRL